MTLFIISLSPLFPSFLAIIPLILITHLSLSLITIFLHKTHSWVLIVVDELSYQQFGAKRKVFDMLFLTFQWNHISNE